MKALLKAGVPVVIATSAPVGDRSATQFSISFFQSLSDGNKSIQEAFDDAIGPAQTVSQKDFNVKKRDIGLLSEKGIDSDEPQWGLYWRKESDLDWKLPKAAVRLTEPPVYAEEYFIGRDQVVNDLHDSLQQDKRVVVRGIGGIGKSAVARKYFGQFENQYKYTIWIDQITGFKEALVTNLELIENLDMEFEEKANLEDRYDAIIKKLYKIGSPLEKSLLVIDNTYANLADLHDQLPANDKWVVLATSREKVNTFKEFPLDKLSPQSARELFEHHNPLGEDDKPESLNKLLKFIDYHTLTVESFAKSLAAEMFLSVDDLREKVENFQLTELQEAFFTGHSMQDVQLISHLMATFDPDLLEAPAQKILQQLSVLPSIDIPFSTLKSLFPKEKNLDGTFGSLAKSGWINRNPKLKSIRIHPLIQEVLKYHFTKTSEEGKHDKALLLEAVNPLIGTLSGLLSIDQTKDNPVHKFPWAPYGERFVSHFKESLNSDLAKLENNLVPRPANNTGIFEGGLSSIKAAKADFIGNN